MKLLLITVTLLVLSGFNTNIKSQSFGGKKSEWHGFSRFDFQLGDISCRVVAPKSVSAGKPWIWRARFWGHQPQVDIALLNKGWHLAYCEVGGLFGNKAAVSRWNQFYTFLTSNHGFSKKVSLEGMSRGGLIIYNWAAANPDKVAAIYGDAPVCDIKSWPGGKGSSKGSPKAWLQCLSAYELSENEVMIFKGNPIDKLKLIAAAKIPILHVIGDADTVVPPSENSDLIESRYRKLGGNIEVIRKKGIGHHPHCLNDPKPIVDFLLRHGARQPKK